MQRLGRGFAGSLVGRCTSGLRRPAIAEDAGNRVDGYPPRMLVAHLRIFGGVPGSEGEVVHGIVGSRQIAWHLSALRIRFSGKARDSIQQQCQSGQQARSRKQLE